MTIDEKMAELFAEWQFRPFQWGKTDCCQFAARSVQFLHGITPPATPPYCTRRAALRVVRGLGGYVGMMQSAGLVKVATTAAQRGDIVIVKPGANDAIFGGTLALVTGTSAHTTGPHGLVAISRTSWLEVWGKR